jgi:hypothetical protein
LGAILVAFSALNSHIEVSISGSSLDFRLSLALFRRFLSSPQVSETKRKEKQ